VLNQAVFCAFKTNDKDMRPTEQKEARPHLHLLRRGLLAGNLVLLLLQGSQHRLQRCVCISTTTGCRALRTGERLLLRGRGRGRLERG
jgi:hypothetical protein